MSLAWYVVQVATNMEDKVQSTLVLNIINKIDDYAHLGLTDKANSIREAFGIGNDLENNAQIDEYLKTKVILVPKEKVEEVRNGKKRENDRKIFPGYVLVKMDYSDEVGLLVRKTPKVSSFIGVAKDSRPVPISQKEVDSILQQVNDSKEKAKHKVEFEIGEKVRIVDGPFVDFNAVIEDVLYDKFRLRVNVQIFGRETSVDLEFGQVEKLG
ncbi:MAG TPA: transcription termination/antitermination protein NusG [Burkholderiales bacterium]|jgi:transcriptional antiterminator NusG|nr:transcription termination/antitermination protein NusG [Burkholderiales bacterium]